MYIYVRYLPKTIINWAALMWRNIGFMIDALVSSCKFSTLDPFKGLVKAWHRALIVKSYAGIMIAQDDIER